MSFHFEWGSSSADFPRFKAARASLSAASILFGEKNPGRNFPSPHFAPNVSAEKTWLSLPGGRCYFFFPNRSLLLRVLMGVQRVVTETHTKREAA